MTEISVANSIDRNPELVVAAVYERVIEASLERVWENVYDWEHLPYLHSEAFTSISLVDSGSWGWRARVGMSGNQDGEIELITDRAALHYVARTLDGPGASNETWTSLDPVSEHRTGIRVEFCAPPIEEESLRQFGNGMIGLYTLLWNQDEEMMRTRTRALADRDSGDSSWQRPATPAETIPLGSIEAFRARLPFSIEAQGHAYRIIETEGEFVAHSTQCPHLLGPLENCEVHDGVIACPWHGYTFDVRSGRSGRSADGHSLRLRPAPRIEIDEAADSVVATFAKGERDRVQVEADHESS